MSSGFHGVYSQSYTCVMTTCCD